MAQNTSHAVMAQRAEPHDSLDFFPTPPWATRALCEFIAPHLGKTVWEPACGRGHMARPLGEYFKEVYASDVEPYGFGEVADFLLMPAPERYDWIITNPPFRLAEQFARRALERGFSRDGVALLVRTSFLEGTGRYKQLFTKRPPQHILQFTERVPMHKGRVEAKGSTATAYCWIIWSMWSGMGPPEFGWIAPCRKRLERPSDYEAA